MELKELTLVFQLVLVLFKFINVKRVIVCFAITVEDILRKVKFVCVDRKNQD